MYNEFCCPDKVIQLLRVSSQYTKVAGSILGQGTYKNQPINTQMSGKTNPCSFLSCSSSLSLSLKSKRKSTNVCWYEFMQHKMVKWSFSELPAGLGATGHSYFPFFVSTQQQRSHNRCYQAHSLFCLSHCLVQFLV